MNHAKKSLWLGAISALALAFNANAESPRSVDASTLDVAGVKLGMGYQEAISAASKYLHVQPSSMKPDQYPSTNSMIFVVTKQKLPSYFVYENKGVRLQVSFQPRIPFNKDTPLAVNQVTYSVPWTPQSAENFKKALISKYGQPSNGTVPVAWEWCAKPSPNIGMGCSMYHGAVLKSGQTDLTLYDPKYSDAVNKYRQDLQSTTPSF